MPTTRKKKYIRKKKYMRKKKYTRKGGKNFEVKKLNESLLNLFDPKRNDVTRNPLYKSSSNNSISQENNNIPPLIPVYSVVKRSRMPIPYESIRSNSNSNESNYSDISVQSKRDSIVNVYPRLHEENIYDRLDQVNRNKNIHKIIADRTYDNNLNNRDPKLRKAFTKIKID